MCIGGSELSILTQFLSNRSQHVKVDGCRCKLVDVESGVAQGSVLNLLLFLLYTSELFSILENKLIGCADDGGFVICYADDGGFVICYADDGGFVSYADDGGFVICYADDGGFVIPYC